MNVLGRLMTQAGEHGKALETFKRVLELTGRNITFLPAYADALAAVGEHAEAVAVAAEAMAAVPQAANLRYWYADHLWRAGDREAAVSSARRAFDMDPNPSYAARAEQYAGLMARRRSLPAAVLHSLMIRRRSLFR